MIVFDLSCANGHVFEGWFGSSGDFESQKDRGLLACPRCGNEDVIKAPMAPAVPRKGGHDAPVRMSGEGGSDQPMSNAPMTPEVRAALAKLAEAQARALKSSKWVGKKFAEDARAMHYGERDAEPIHGEASIEDARSLIDEGIDVAPLPFPVTPPEDLN